MTRVYDAAGRLTTEQQRLPEGTVNQVGYAYANGNRVTGVAYPGGRSATSAYTVRNTLRDVWFDGVSSAIRSFDAGGRLLSTTYGNGLIEGRG